VSSNRVEPHSREAKPDARQYLIARPVAPLHHWYSRYKVVADFLLAAILTVPILPVVALAALCVKLTSKGPAFYTQTRVGRDGKNFKIYKLRTMVHNAEALTGPVWSQSGDQRVTWLGKWFRELHIDEFPQLYNVLLGQMSLVGPRPERPE